MDSINETLGELLKIFIDDLSEFFVIARIIAGIGLAISTYFTFFQIMGGDDESVKKYLTKFLVVFLGIVYYPTLLLIINYPLDIITVSVKNISDKNVAKNTYVWDKELSQNGVNNNFQTNAEYEKEFNRIYPVIESDDNTFMGSLKSLGADIANSVAGMIQEIIATALRMLADLALIILNVIRYFFLIVLSMFGIFVIALSSFPTLEGSFSQWLTKYINVYLWLAIGYILKSILTRVELLANVKALNQQYEIETAGSSMISLLINLCTIIGFLSIPTLSSWMINAATNGVGSKMAQSAKQIHSQMVSSTSKAAAATASGGASAATSAVI